MPKSWANLSETEKHTLLMMVDFEYCAQAMLKVQTTDSTLVSFEVNGPQRILIDIFDRVKQERPLRAIILKGRRMGVSTLISGRFYQKTSFFPNKYAMQITHEPQATEFLFRMVKRFYDFSPKAHRPELRANNLTLLEFNNRDGTGLNSGFRVATSGKSDIGSGQLIHYLHASEAAKWDAKNAETLLTAVLQCVPKDGKTDTEIIYESTANGIGGMFYDKFWGARYRYWVEKLDDDGKPVIKKSINAAAPEINIETAIFLPWFCFEKNALPVPEGFKLNDEEVAYRDQYNLSDEQMYWRRFTIENECWRGNMEASLRIFRQEHPATPSEAFLGTGSPVFDNEELQRLKMAGIDPIARYMVHPDSSEVTKDKAGPLRVWEEPKVNKRYVIGVDVAEGLAVGDWSVIQVVDHASGEQVAEWHGKCEPYELARIAVAVAKRYNMALLAIESNNHGRSTIDAVLDMGYRNMWVDEIPDPPRRPRKRWGWRTDRNTKPRIIDSLIRDINEGTHGIKSRDLLDEMISYKRNDDGSTEAEYGRHDDRVMAYAIAKFVKYRSPLPRAAFSGGQRVSNKILKQPTKLAWT